MNCLKAISMSTVVYTKLLITQNMKCSNFLLTVLWEFPFPVPLKNITTTDVSILNLVLLTIVFFLVIYLLKKRTDHRKALTHLRTKLSSDLHDDVGTLLSGLAMQAELLAMQPKELDTDKLIRIASMSRTAMLQMRDLVWAIDNRKDKWENLIDRLYEHASDVLTPLHIDFKLEVEGIDPNFPISPELRQNLYLIGKEAITNVAKHSDAAIVTIMIRKRNGKYDMEIQDNGHFQAEEKQAISGLGLSNIKWRAKQLGAKLSFQDREGFGIFLQRIEMG